MISEWIYGYEFHIEKAMFSDWNPELTSCLVDCHVYPCSFQMATIQPPSCLVQWFTSYLMVIFNGIPLNWQRLRALLILTDEYQNGHSKPIMATTNPWIDRYIFQLFSINHCILPNQGLPPSQRPLCKAEPIRLCHFWPYFRRSTPPQLTYLTYTLPNVGVWKIMFNSK